MQLTTTKENIASPLSLVAGAADPRGQIQMLGTVLLKTTQGKLSLLCSDSAVLARALAVCDVGSDGEVAVDVKRLSDLVRALPDKENINISLEEKGTLLVKAGRSRFRLPTHKASEYPRMSTVKEQRVTLAISAKRLAEMFEQVADSMATADIRTYLNGALVSLRDGHLVIVGTDGFRMVITKEPIPGSESISPRSIIMPRKSALLARRLLAVGGEVKLALGSADLQLTFTDGTVLVARSLEGAYPDFERAVPKYDATASVSSRKFSEAVGLIDATTEAADKNLGRIVAMTFSDKTLTLSSGENGRCEIDAESTQPNNQELTFNVDYLRSAVATIGATGEAMRISYPSMANVVCLRPSAAEFPLAVVMGMRK